MTREQRDKATRDQIERFFSSYFSSWRLQQILTIEKLLEEKFTFYPSIISDTKQFDDSTGESTIAQEITNGLLFDAISNSVQYIEDLFALIKAGENKDYFIKNIITYGATTINNFIKLNTNEEKICKLFYFPYFNDNKDDNDKDEYAEGISILYNWIIEIKQFYSKYQFFYKQYKHGLTIALRPFGRYTVEQILKSKSNDLDPYLAAFDNMELTKLKDQKDRLDDYVLMPCMTENVVPHIHKLMQEDNFVRYIRPPNDTNIQNIKNIAFKIRMCINIFTNNMIFTIRDERPYKRIMPSPEFGKAYQFTFDSLPESTNENRNNLTNKK